MFLPGSSYIHEDIEEYLKQKGRWTNSNGEMSVQNQVLFDQLKQINLLKFSTTTKFYFYVKSEKKEEYLRNYENSFLDIRIEEIENFVKANSAQIESFVQVNKKLYELVRDYQMHVDNYRCLLTPEVVSNCELATHKLLKLYIPYSFLSYGYINPNLKKLKLFLKEEFKRINFQSAHISNFKQISELQGQRRHLLVMSAFLIQKGSEKVKQVVFKQLKKLRIKIRIELDKALYTELDYFLKVMEAEERYGKIEAEPLLSFQKNLVREAQKFLVGKERKFNPKSLNEIKEDNILRDYKNYLDFRNIEKFKTISHFQKKMLESLTSLKTL